MKIRNLIFYFSKFEWSLWITSIIAVIISFIYGNQENPLTLIASLIGVTALIFLAKANVIGQILTICFSLIYAIISYQFQYYGEMITYLGMTTPIAIFSTISWLKHPYKKFEVQIARLDKYKIFKMISLTLIVTFVFYFILKYFNTANLYISTISITTSFLASFLMLYRSPIYALAYSANDVVLIILWILASITNISYFPIIICFFMFLLNDLYAYFNWYKLLQRQNEMQ